MQGKRAIFVSALLSGTNITKAAELAKVTRETGSRWLADDAEIQRALAVGADRILSQTENLMRAAVLDAIASLRTLAKMAVLDSDKVAAARAILAHSATLAKLAFDQDGGLEFDRTAVSKLAGPEIEVFRMLRWNLAHNVAVQVWTNAELRMLEVTAKQ